jgi:hypothetical protein
LELAAGNLLSVVEAVQTTQHAQAMIYGLRRGFGLLIQLVTGIIEQGGFGDLRQRRAFRPPTDPKVAVTMTTPETRIIRWREPPRSYS